MSQHQCHGDDQHAYCDDQITPPSGLKFAGKTSSENQFGRWTLSIAVNFQSSKINAQVLHNQFIVVKRPAVDEEIAVEPVHEGILLDRG